MAPEPSSLAVAPSCLEEEEASCLEGEAPFQEGEAPFQEEEAPFQGEEEVSCPEGEANYSLDTCPAVEAAAACDPHFLHHHSVVEGFQIHQRSFFRFFAKVKSQGQHADQACYLLLLVVMKLVDQAERKVRLVVLCSLLSLRLLRLCGCWLTGWFSVLRCWLRSSQISSWRCEKIFYSFPTFSEEPETAAPPPLT